MHVKATASDRLTRKHWASEMKTIKLRHNLFLIYCFLVVAVAGCSSPSKMPTAKPLPESMNVIWSLYSGLPDPGWTITSKATIQEISTTLASLPRADDTEWRGYLGPDCFKLSCPKGMRLPMLSNVSRDFIKIYEDTTNGIVSAVLRDRNRRIKAILDRTRPKDL